MRDNPFESPQTPGKSAPKNSKLDENTKEFLGIAKDDFWYYPGFVLLVAACFFSNHLIVFFLFALSTIFLLIYLVKSFPKYLGSSQLNAFTRAYGFLANLALIALQLVVVAVKAWFLSS